MYANTMVKAEEIANATDRVDIADVREAIATILHEQYPDKYSRMDDARTRLEELEDTSWPRRRHQ